MPPIAILRRWLSPGGASLTLQADCGDALFNLPSPDCGDFVGLSFRVPLKTRQHDSYTRVPKGEWIDPERLRQLALIVEILV